MIDAEIFKQQLALLADRIGRPLAGPTQVEYYRQLSPRLTTQQFLAASTLVFNTWRAEYRNWPSPQQFVELIAPVARPTLSAVEAFERVLDATNDPRLTVAEQRVRVQELGAVTVRAFHAAGGMREFRNVLETEIAWLRKRFVGAYEMVCESADAEQAAAVALGDADARVAAITSSLATKMAMPAQKSISAPEPAHA